MNGDVDPPPYSGKHLYLRDLSARTTVELTDDATHNNGFPPAADGRVVYSAGYPDGTSYLYEDGESTLFAGGDGVGAQYVGDSTYYFNVGAYPDVSVWMYDGSTHHLVTDEVAWNRYVARGGWVSFIRKGGLNQDHVWLRSPDGDERQITFFSGSSELEGVSPTGEVFFLYDDRRYWDDATGVLVEIGSDQGAVEWMDGAWYLTLGRSLFTLDPSAVPVEGDAPEQAVVARIESVSPNPIPARATVTFSLPRTSSIRLSVLDALGRRVATLARGEYRAGVHTADWSAEGTPSGIYIIVLEAGAEEAIRRVTVIR